MKRKIRHLYRSLLILLKDRQDKKEEAGLRDHLKSILDSYSVSKAKKALVIKDLHQTFTEELLSTRLDLESAERIIKEIN